MEMLTASGVPAVVSEPWTPSTRRVEERVPNCLTLRHCWRCQQKAFFIVHCLVLADMTLKCFLV